MTRVFAFSDIHGYLPIVPHDADLVLIAGDIVPLWGHDPYISQLWLDTTWREYLETITVPVVFTPGNHDIIFERSKHLVPSDLKWHYLEDSGIDIKGLRIWGSPWQPTYGTGWAFNMDEENLYTVWNKIPENTDILLTHSPPKGYGDWSPYGNEHVGSPSLLERVLEVQPRYMFAGHLHSGYGQYQIGKTIFYNVALVDEGYRPVNPPVEINYE